MGLFKPRSISHKRLLNSCPREENTRSNLGNYVFIHIGVGFFELVERLILGGSCSIAAICNHSHHSAVVLCSRVGKLSNFRVKFRYKIRSLLICAMAPDLLSITSASNRMVTRVKT